MSQDSHFWTGWDSAIFSVAWSQNCYPGQWMQTKNKAGSDLANHRSDCDCRTLSVYSLAEQLLLHSKPLVRNLWKVIHFRWHKFPGGRQGGGEEEEIYTEKSLIFDQVPLPQWVLELLEKRENTGSQSSLQNHRSEVPELQHRSHCSYPPAHRACLSMICKSLPRLIFNLLLPHLSFPSSSSPYLPATAFYDICIPTTWVPGFYSN